MHQTASTQELRFHQPSASLPFKYAGLTSHSRRTQAAYACRMGSNSGYGNNGFFENNFNQEGFSQSPFMGRQPPPQFFQAQQQTQPNVMGFEGNSSGEGYMNDEIQSNNGLFKETAFSHDQFSSPVPQVSAADQPTTFRILYCNGMNYRYYANLSCSP